MTSRSTPWWPLLVNSCPRRTDLMTVQLPDARVGTRSRTGRHRATRSRSREPLATPEVSDAVDNRDAEPASDTATRPASTTGGRSLRADNATAGSAGDIVVVAVRWEGHAALANGSGAVWARTVVVDCVNPPGFDTHGSYALSTSDGAATHRSRCASRHRRRRRLPQRQYGATGGVQKFTGITPSQQRVPGGRADRRPHLCKPALQGARGRACPDI